MDTSQSGAKTSRVAQVFPWLGRGFTTKSESLMETSSNFSTTIMAPSAAALQLSTFTRAQCIPRTEKYPDFPVTVRLAAPGADRPVRAPVDIVAAIDKSVSSRTNMLMLELEKAALALVIEKLGPDDRLAVLPFNYQLNLDTAVLVPMSDRGKKTVGEKVRELAVGAGDGADIVGALNKAEKILKARGGSDAGRAAFILLLSDGEDGNVLTGKLRLKGASELNDHSYPVHTFGFAKHNSMMLCRIAEKSNGGKYFPEDIAVAGDVPMKFAAGFDAVLCGATARPFSATGARVGLLALHHGVSISRIESSGEKKLIDSSISGDGRSGEAVFGDVAAGETPEFTMYLDVPEGDKDAEAMDVLAVTGAYTQAWDGKHVETARSVVSVSRPPPPPPLPKPEPEPEPKPEPVDPCKGLNEILERFEYWCKVKKDLSAMDDKANEKVTKCCCTSVALAREAALESVNRAMHHDIYTAAFRVTETRKCGEAVKEGGQDGGETKTAVYK